MDVVRQRDEAWWRTAVVYQVYVRSFADSDGDGVGDLGGVRAHLGHLVDLGVDAIWLTPFYPSAGADGGYDVADYRAVSPDLGDLEQAEALIAQAAGCGIATIVDVVPNHVASTHPWFVAALASPPGSPERERFWFRDGRGADGGQPPNGWVSEFGGVPWTRTRNPDGSPGQWYLHLFTPQQPDLNWTHPDVAAEHEDVLRFWFDRGAAGVRVDSAALLVKDPALPDVPAELLPGGHPYVDRDDLHEVYRGWRRVADSYAASPGGSRVLVGEVWLDDPERFAAYLRPDEIHTAFNVDLMARPFDAKELRDSIETTLAAHAGVGAPATWVLSNHDVTRPVTRYGRAESGFSFAAKRFGAPTDLALGTARARAAALLVAALPGSLYVYQGDELGLFEAEVPREAILDPMHQRSGGRDPGRDGCRVPLPWTSGGADSTSLGFSPPGAAAPWLPQPAGFAALSVAAQADDPGSMLSLHRRALALRRTLPALAGEHLAWRESHEGTLAFERGRGDDGVLCVLNTSGAPIPLPAGEVLLASAAVDEGALPDGACAWLRPAGPTRPPLPRPSTTPTEETR